MRKPTTPSTMLITKVGVSASLDKDDVNRRLETELYQRNIMISPYKFQFGPLLRYSPVKLLPGVKTMVTSHVMLPQARCCCWGEKAIL